MSTSAQRLQWDWDDRTRGADQDPSLEEQLETQDHEFRHFDSYTFAHTAPLTGCWDKGTRERPAATPSSAGGGPHLPVSDTESQTQPPTSDLTGGEACPSTVPPEGTGLAIPSEHWMWTT